MRRFLALVLAAMMIMSLAACGKTEDETTPDNTASNEQKYMTATIDLSQLSDGNQHIIFHTEPWEGLWGVFSGWEETEQYGYDCRSMDINKADLSEIDDLNKITFDSKTVWPDELPEGFEPNEILEINKNPGLHIRQLHEQGITGKGIGIAIIDQGLYTEHEEYKDRLKSYDVINVPELEYVAMHGAPVASIAVGKNVGVAPEANLYYIYCGDYTNKEDGTGQEEDLSFCAESILRICDMNKYLPNENRIRVISISSGYSANIKGYHQMQKAIKTADEQGILVLTTTPDMYYGDIELCGLIKNYTDDPDDVASFYLPEEHAMNLTPLVLDNKIFAPMTRTYASNGGPDSYEVQHEGGWSWVIPWYSGLYALCCQVDPEITPRDFIELIKSTADVVPQQIGEKTLKIKIVNPVAAIDELRK